MEKGKKEVPEVEFIDMTDSDYKEHHVTDAFGGFVPTGMFSVTFFDVHQKPYPERNDKVQMIRTKKVRLILSPPALKSISDWLSNHANKVKIGNEGDRGFKGDFSATPIKP